MSTGEGSHWLTASAVAATESRQVVRAQAQPRARAPFRQCGEKRARRALRALGGAVRVWAEGKGVGVMNYRNWQVRD